MFMKAILGGTAALALSAGASLAATQDFVVDWDNSSVELNDQSGGGLACLFSSCGVSVDLTGAPTSFTLSEGSSNTFDFLRWEGDGTAIIGREFSVTAKLAFDPPVSSGSSDGSGRAYIFKGSIFGGALTWDDIPTITAANGSVFDLSFQGGASWLIDGDKGYTSSATVSLISAVPLPASSLMLLAGVGGLAAMRRRQKKNKS